MAFATMPPDPPSTSPTPGSIRLGSLDLTPSAAPNISVCAVGFENIAGLPDFWIPRLRDLRGGMNLGDLQPGSQDEPADPVATETIDALAATKFPDDSPQTPSPDRSAIHDAF